MFLANRFGIKILVFLIFPLPFLAGCTGAETGFALAVGATSTLINTDKLPFDHIGDAVTGLDCNSLRRMEDGGALCRSKDYGRVIEKPVYCYPTLGEMDCYAYPDPMRK